MSEQLEQNTLVMRAKGVEVETPKLARDVLRERVMSLLWAQGGVEVGGDEVSSGVIEFLSTGSGTVHAILKARRCVYDQASVTIGEGDKEPQRVVLDAMPSEIPAQTAADLKVVLDHVEAAINRQT